MRFLQLITCVKSQEDSYDIVFIICSHNFVILVVIQITLLVRYDMHIRHAVTIIGPFFIE